MDCLNYQLIGNYWGLAGGKETRNYKTKYHNFLNIYVDYELSPTFIKGRVTILNLFIIKCRTTLLAIPRMAGLGDSIGCVFFFTLLKLSETIFLYQFKSQ